VTRRCSSLVPGATGVYFQSRSSQEPGIFRVAGPNGKIELALSELGLKRVGLFAMPRLASQKNSEDMHGLFFRSQLVRVVALLLLLLTCLAAGQAQSAPGFGDRERIARAANRVLVGGLHAKIPPHVSDMLGISANGKECQVAQRFERAGNLVRTFNVSITDKNNIVLFITDEAANEQTYYLTSDQGRLRRVLAVRGGTGNVLRVTGKERTAFARELQFWLDRIVPATTSK
jgi:hypothetical protein